MNSDAALLERTLPRIAPVESGLGQSFSRVIAVASGKGGVGKTNLVVNLGLVLVMLGRRVLILDADLGLASADVLLGLNPRYHLKHVFQGQMRLEEVVVEGPRGLKVISGGSGLPELAELSPEERSAFLEEVGMLEGLADILLIDAAPGISRAVTQFVRAAGEAIVITTPEPTAITDAYALVKVLAPGLPPRALRLLVNMAASRWEAEDTAEKLIRVVREFLGVELEALGYLPYDARLPQAVRMQVPLVLAYPHSPLAARFKALGQEILRGNGQPSAGEKLGGFFQKMAQMEV